MTVTSPRVGTIYGVGLGPGDPELMSVRADRLVRSARHVAYFRKQGRKGHALRCAENLLPPDATHIDMVYPVTTEIPFGDARYTAQLSQFYAACTARLRAVVTTGADVVVLCEGDPFFYGSFMHLYTRLVPDTPVNVTPAITGMSGAWTAIGMPMTWGDDVMTVVMATLPQDELSHHIAKTDALVVMKIGRNFPKVRQALVAAGKHDAAWLVTYATLPEQTVTPVSEIEDDTADVPYFSIVIVPGQGRRP